MSKKKAPRRLGQKSLRLFGYALAFALQFFLDNAVKSIGSPASFNETYSKVFLPSRFSLSSLYPYIAHTLSRHSVALNTVVVTLGKDEPINYSDNCARRRLISDALIAIGSAKPGAIGVDYNFNRFGCASAQDTEWLRRSLNQVGANVPIVLGQQ